MKKLIIFFIVEMLILIHSAFSITNGCANEVDINTACVIRTPPISCSTYDLYNSTNNLSIDDGSMSEIFPGSGVYNFTFNEPDLGIHTVVLCDNTSTQINIETTDETDLGTILSNQITIQNNILSVNRTKASIENISTILENITKAQDGIITRGDIAWITAVGFSTHSAADIWSVATRTLTSFGSLVSDIWNAATRTLTTADWQTESDALTRFLSLGEGIQTNATAISVNVTSEVDDISISITDSDKEDIADKVMRRPVTNTTNLNDTIGIIVTINETTYFIERLI